MHRVLDQHRQEADQWLVLAQTYRPKEVAHGPGQKTRKQPVPDATEVNRALGTVFTLLAQNRIPGRNAVALGYIAQLMLQALPRVREEIIAGLGHSGWQDTPAAAFREDEDDDEAETKEPADKETESSAASPAAGQTNDNAENIEAQAKQEADRGGALGAPISRLASFSQETSPATPVDAASDHRGRAAIARGFVESALADSSGPAANPFRMRTCKTRAASPAK